jgi:hypothetical protein
VADLVALPDVKLALNMNAADTTHDAELQDFISGVTAVVEFYTGPIIPADFDEYHDGGSWQLVLRNTPVLSLATLTEMVHGTILQTLSAEPQDGTAPVVDGYGYSLETSTGIVTRRRLGTAAPFARGRRNVHAVYTAGFATVPPNVKRAALDLLAFNYDPQRGPRKQLGRPMAGAEDAQPTMGFWVPNRVVEQLAGNLRIPGIA